jgi:hypothetical protein
MKKTKIIYWVITILFGGFMLFSAIPDIISTSEAIDFMSKGLGYPSYIIPFIGVAKALGVIAILVPGFPRLKEWAYAGLFIDLTGATYSFIALGKTPAEWSPMLIFIAFGALSYIYYHKTQRIVKTESI